MEFVVLWDAVHCPVVSGRSVLSGPATYLPYMNGSVGEDPLKGALQHDVMRFVQAICLRTSA